MPKATAGVSVELGVEFWVNLPKAKSGTAEPSYFEEKRLSGSWRRQCAPPTFGETVIPAME